MSSAVPAFADLLSLIGRLPEQSESFEARVQTLLDAGDAALLDRLFVEAGYHGVSGVVDPRLAALAVPAPLRQKVQRRLAIEDVWQGHVRQSLADVVAVLNGAGVIPGALKGPVLGQRFYAPDATRYCMDLDLLVRISDFEPATRALIDAGYVPEDGLTAAYHRQFSHHVGFARRGSPPLELHFRAYTGFGVDVAGEPLLDRASMYALGSEANVLTLSPEDEFIYLAVHAAGHSFIRLVWLYDLKLLMQGRVMDWQAIAERAAFLGVAHVVAYTSALLHRLMHVPLPPRQLARPGLRTRVADALIGTASVSRERGWRDNFEGLLFTSMLCDSPRSTAWLLQHHLTRGLKRRLKASAPSLLPDAWGA